MEDRSGQAEAFEVGWERLSSHTPKALAANSGAILMPDGRTLRLKVMDRECEIDLKNRKIRYASDRKAEVGMHIQILILHYLAGAGNAQLSNRLATFSEFEGGSIYYPAFKARAIDAIVRTFGNNPQVLRHIGAVLRAEPVSAGDVGFKLYLFPKMPVVVVFWAGDEEVPASANILFDANVGKMLPTEDLSVAGGVVVRWLTDISRR